MTPRAARIESSIAANPNWSVERLTPPSRFFGANGMRTGSDGLIYVAQLAGSQISALDPDSGEITVVSPFGGDIVGPDDLAFDEDGNLYVTEYTEGRVSVLRPDGTARVLQDGMPLANPITYHRGRLIAGECRPGARIMELDRDGGAPRIVLDDVPMANAFEVGPDGKLYFPVMGTNEIWRVDLDGGEPEVVAGDLGVPDSVKFDSKGFIVSTQVGSGEVLRIDPRDGSRTVLADIGPGLDNVTFVGDRLFVSHMTGSVHEILAPGELRALSEKGFLWPMDVSAGGDGSVFVADGSYCYVRQPGDTLKLVGMLFTPGYPGFTRGVAWEGPGAWICATSNGELKRWRPEQQLSEELASGFDVVTGVAVAADGRMIFAEYGTGRIHALENGEVSEIASGLDTPMGVALSADGTCFVAERDSGRVVKLVRGGTETVLDGLRQPEGLTVHGGKLYVIDVVAKELVECGLDGSDRQVIASGLPVGGPTGVPRKDLGGAGVFSGPMLSFNGLSAGPDGTLHFAADGEGSVMTARPKG